MIKQLNAIGIIPARYASTRLKVKPLVDIGGIPLIIRVWKNISESKSLKRVVVATDDERILEICNQYGAEAVLTPKELVSGTDRVYNAYKKIGASEEIIVNIQGDEPLLTYDIVDNLLEKFALSSADVATIITKINDEKELFSENCVKVVIDKNNIAIYFSRSPIPYLRDKAKSEWIENALFWKHIGIYAYKKEALEKFVNLPVSKYENLEKLEQLRLLEENAKYLCVECNKQLIGVDTPEDLELVRKIIINNNLTK